MQKCLSNSTLFCSNFAHLNAPEEMETCFEALVCPNFRIEWMVQRPRSPDYQAIIFFHGASDMGLRSIFQVHFDYWLKKGYAVACISMPGFGQSSGKRDFCGPVTLNALSQMIDRIKKELGVFEFGVIAFGQGALAATLLSAKRSDIKAIIAANGGYDLFRHNTPDDLLFKILKEKKYELDCNDHDALFLRSPICHILKIKAPMFLIHRKGNPVISETEAMDFYKAMYEAGKECHLIVKERQPGDDEQKISFNEIWTATESWFNNLMQT